MSLEPSENKEHAGALAEAVNKAAMQLPERVMMALVQTPAMFAVPNCINKGFAPPFIVRVGVVSAVPTQIKATIAGYVLQKEQVGPLLARVRLKAPLLSYHVRRAAPRSISLVGFPASYLSTSLVVAKAVTGDTHLLWVSLRASV